jgi:hypothetical protein
MTLTTNYESFAVYPEKRNLADLSTIFKIEGHLTLAKNALNVLYGSKIGTTLSLGYEPPSFLLLLAPSVNEMVKWLSLMSKAFDLGYELSSGDAFINGLIPPDVDQIYLLMDDLKDVRLVTGETLRDTKLTLERVLADKHKTNQIRNFHQGSSKTNRTAKKMVWITPPPFIVGKKQLPAHYQNPNAQITPVGPLAAIPQSHQMAPMPIESVSPIKPKAAVSLSSVSSDTSSSSSGSKSTSIASVASSKKGNRPMLPSFSSS